mgnify:CR=1 FL=1
MIATEQEEVLERLELTGEQDVVRIRQVVRMHGKELGVGLINQTRITTAASEILRNMYVYAGGGTVDIAKVRCEERPALLVTCADQGPGIEDIEQAMQDGYTTSRSLGSGLPGSRRLVDRFEIESTPGEGTTVQLLQFLG